MTKQTGSFFSATFVSSDDLPRGFDEAVRSAMSATSLLSLCCIVEVDGQPRPWVSSAFFAFDASATLYVLSPLETKHGLVLRQRPDVAMTVANSQQTFGAPLVGLQASGRCYLAEGAILDAGLAAYRGRFPATAATLQSRESFAASGWDSRLWAIELDRVKLFDETRFEGDKQYTAAVTRE